MNQENIIELEEECPNCGKIIYGETIKLLDWNFDLHKQSCKFNLIKQNNGG